jgi:hypothetical protein
MCKVQMMYQIPSHGERHSTPDDRKEIETLMTYIKENKLQQFVKNRDGNDVVIPTQDLLLEGGKHVNKANAFKSFKGYQFKVQVRFDSANTSPAGNVEDKVEDEVDAEQPETVTRTLDDILESDDDDFIFDGVKATDADDLRVDAEEFTEDIEQYLQTGLEATNL